MKLQSKVLYDLKRSI